MDIIELTSGSAKAIIDPSGGWVTNLSDDSGDILFPKRKLKTPDGESKTRGGCHVCLPNFGPGGDSGQPQHGFGRTMEWIVLEQQQSRVEIELAQGRDGYESLTSIALFELKQRQLTMTLTLINGVSNKLRVAPGFHPYFALSRGEQTVSLNGTEHVMGDLAGTEFFKDITDMFLQTDRRNITLHSENLPTWALWTDQLGDYVCVEPTVGGYTFLQRASAGEVLKSGENRTYSLTISW